MESSQFIKIQNFRCFQNLEINGFKRVNLISGKNNTGKTSLLEVMLVYFYPVDESFFILSKVRREQQNKLTRKPSHNSWENLFSYQNLSYISIEGFFKNAGEKTIKISIDKDSNSSNRFDSPIEDVERLVLEVEDITNQNTSRHKLSNKSKKINLNDELRLPFVPSSYSLSNKEIVELYDKIDYEGRSEEILKILKILIPSIMGLKTYSFIEPTLHIQTTDNPHKGIPISLFGDAVYRITVIVLVLLNRQHNILLIDEIENGIHYTCQKDVWLGLFRLAEKLDTLIFATTHSLEMIKAFAEAGQDFPDQGAYFELAYSPRSQNIIAINRDMDTLQYDLEHGKAIRGE